MEVFTQGARREETKRANKEKLAAAEKVKAAEACAQRASEAVVAAQTAAASREAALSAAQDALAKEKAAFAVKDQEVGELPGLRVIECKWNLAVESSGKVPIMKG